LTFEVCNTEKQRLSDLTKEAGREAEGAKSGLTVVIGFRVEAEGDSRFNDVSYKLGGKSREGSEGKGGRGGGRIGRKSGEGSHLAGSVNQGRGASAHPNTTRILSINVRTECERL